MRALLLVVMTLCGIAPLHAQQPCSPAAAQHDAATVTQIRSSLRALKLSDDGMDTDVPTAVQQQLSALKSALAQTALDVLACHPISLDHRSLQTQLATLLHANPPPVPPSPGTTPATPSSSAAPTAATSSSPSISSRLSS